MARLTFLCCTKSAEQNSKKMESPIVEIQQGKLKGDTGNDLNGQPFLRFLGIPYGKPPTGELRFKIAQPAEPWSGIKDATKNGDSCFQRNTMLNEFSGSEDCLNLNVFTKELPSSKSKLKPVMVYIHGGAFTMGSNDYSQEGPEYLITEDIVLVVINYRLGLLGFLSVDDTSLNIPGNNGLKDQTLALKWVQNNISKFGGDPNDVTIFGCSAGAASVHFQVLSPMAKGLFHKAILQSGCALNPWVWGTRGNASEIAEILGHKVSNEKDAIDVLKQTPVEDLYGAQLKMSESILPSSKRQFSPVIEKPNESAFLTRDPLELMRTGEYNKVPMIFGYTNREGMINEFMQQAFNAKYDGTVLDNAIPRQLRTILSSQDRNDLTKKIKNVYNGPEEKDNEYMLYTDSMFLAQIIESLKLHLKTGSSPLYLYRFTLETQINLVKNMIPTLKNVKGVCHGDDIAYLFKSILAPKLPSGGIEETAVRRYVKLMTNFAKTGNPTPSDELNVIWKPIETDSKINCLDFGEEMVMVVNPDNERMQLWSELFKKYPMVFKN